MDTSSIRTLDQITEEILLLTELPNKFYVRIKQLLIKGYRELNLTTLPEATKIEKFVMDSNYIIYLNDDVILVHDVFVPINGKMWPLSKSTDMVPTTSIISGSEVRDSEDGEGVDIIEHEGDNYSAKGGNNTEGYWYYDSINKRILFTNVSRSEVLVMYTTSGTSLDSVTYVPTYAVDALQNYTLWKLSMLSQNREANLREEYRREYIRQKEICRGIQFNFNEFVDTIYFTMNAGIRRV